MKLLKLKLNNRYRFYIVFFILLFLLFLQYAFLVSIPSLVFVALLVFSAFFGDKDELIAVCICCIPWCTAIESHYVIIFCVVFFLIKYGKKVKLDLGIVPIVLIIVWEILHCFSSGANIKMIISYTCLYLLLIMFFFLRGIQTIDYGFIIRTFALAVFGVCIILVLRLLVHNNFNFEVAFMDMKRLGMMEEEIGGLIINPNSLGIQCVLAAGGLMQIRFAGKKNIFDIVLVVMLLVLGALTGSRTFLACLLILGMFWFVVSKGGMKQKFKILLGSVAILLISILLLYIMFPSTLEMFVQRLSVEDITSGRNDLFIIYNEYMSSSLKSIFWGLGALDLGNKVTRFSIANNVPHNGIQEILVAWGIIGLLLFIAMIFVMIRRSKQENPHQSPINYALLVVLLAKIMVGQVITSTYTMLSFALIYLSLCQDCTKKEFNEKRL